MTTATGGRHLLVVEPDGGPRVVTAENETVDDDALAESLERQMPPKRHGMGIPMRSRVTVQEQALTPVMRWAIIAASFVVALVLVAGVIGIAGASQESMQNCVKAGGTYTRTASEVTCAHR